MEAGEIIKLVLPITLGVSGAAVKAVSWAVRKELNGSAQRIKDINSNVEVLKQGQEVMSTRLTRLETIVEERTDRRHLYRAISPEHQ